MLESRTAFVLVSLLSIILFLRSSGGRSEPPPAATSVTTKIRHQKRYFRPTYDNPVGNVLPYSAERPTERTYTRDKSLETRGVIQDRRDVFEKRLGLRQLVPVEPWPDHAGLAVYSYGETGLRSCKNDRMECLPVASASL